MRMRSIVSCLMRWTRGISRLTRRQNAGSGSKRLTHYPRTSEVEPQRKLQLTGESRLAGDHAKLAGGRIVVRPAQVRMIGEVICFRPKLESASFINCELLEQGQIPILNAGCVNRVAHARLQIERTGRRLGSARREVSGRSGGCYRSGKRSGVDSDGPTQNPILTLRAASAAETAELANSGKIVIGCDPAGRPCLELGCAGNLPAAEQLPGELVVILKERQIVKVVENQDVACVVFGRTPQVAGVVSVGDDISVVGTTIHAL